jgi:hypothetical protein
MKTVRYIVCGAMSGFTVVWLNAALLPGASSIAFNVLPVAMIGGGYYGYRHAKKKRTGLKVAWALRRTASARKSLAPDNLA